MRDVGSVGDVTGVTTLTFARFILIYLLGGRLTLFLSRGVNLPLRFSAYCSFLDKPKDIIFSLFFQVFTNFSKSRTGAGLIYDVTLS